MIMSRENAIVLIRQTMLEFQSNVMEPLRNNINLYNRRGNPSLFLLNDFFDTNSAAIDNMQEMINAMFNIDNFQLSQLFSLCIDISKLYKLPVRNSLPSFISKTSPIKYISPRRTLSSFEAMSGVNIITSAVQMPKEEIQRLRKAVRETIATLATNKNYTDYWVTYNTRRNSELELRIRDGVPKCNIFVYEIITAAYRSDLYPILYTQS